MRNKVVTVFGGTGFVGRHVVRRLAKTGATVRVPSRRPGAASFLRPMGEVGQVVVEPQDGAGLDAAAVARHVAGSTHVVSLVGILFEREKGDFDRVQGRLPGLIGAAAAEAGVQGLAHVSAIGADAGSPSAYARTKAEGEAGLRAAFPGAVILRPSVIFGPEDGFFNRFAGLARVLPFMPVIAADTRFQPVYVGDVAHAVLAAAERDDAAGRTYELAGPRSATFRELLRYIGEVTGRRRPLVEIPLGLARLQARLGEFLPNPPLTRDQLLMLQRDNVPAPDALGLAELGIQPKALEAVVPTYLTRFRAGGGRRPSPA